MIRQRPTITYWITCDVCGEDAGDERSQREAEQRVQARVDGYVRASECDLDLCPGCAHEEADR